MKKMYHFRNIAFGAFLFFGLNSGVSASIIDHIEPVIDKFVPWSELDIPQPIPPILDEILDLHMVYKMDIEDLFDDEIIIRCPMNNPFVRLPIV